LFKAGACNPYIYLMINTIKQLRPLVAKSLMASYCLVATAAPIQGVAATPMTMTEALDSFNEPQPIDPQPPSPPIPTLHAGAQALLETIAFAEGTWNQRTQSISYDMRFGDRINGGSLNTQHPHPQQVRGSQYGSGYRSDASGAYQFLSTTWKLLHRGSNPPMTPANQDAAALKLVQSTGYNTHHSFQSQAHLLAGTWASIPTRSGYSYYNQPVKNFAILSRFYEGRKAFYTTLAAANHTPPQMCLAHKPDVLLTA
jgi:muramidase (phage lysozyme)